MILTSKKIQFESKDIAGNRALLDEMRKFSGEKTFPPQIVNGDTYCGDYDAFTTAIEDEILDEFLNPK